MNASSSSASRGATQSCAATLEPIPARVGDDLVALLLHAVPLHQLAGESGGSRSRADEVQEVRSVLTRIPGGPPRPVTAKTNASAPCSRAIGFTVDGGGLPIGKIAQLGLVSQGLADGERVRRRRGRAAARRASRQRGRSGWKRAWTPSSEGDDDIRNISLSDTCHPSGRLPARSRRHPVRGRRGDSGRPGDAGAAAGAGVPFRLVTNTTSRSRAMLVERLPGLRIRRRAEEIFTATLAGAALVRRQRATGSSRRSSRRPRWRTWRGSSSPAERRPARAARPDAVVLGDLGERLDVSPCSRRRSSSSWRGAALVALSRDRYFQRDQRLALDAGPFVAALEYATARTARVAGKPSPALLRRRVWRASAWRRAAPPPWWATTSGPTSRAPSAPGCQGWLVRTGKFREEVLRDQRHPARPDPRPAWPALAEA